MPKEKPLELVRIPLSQIKPDPKNAKDHDVGLIIESFRRFGYVNPMVLNSDDFLLAGHGRRKALLAMQGDNESPPKNIETEGDEWIVPVGIGPDFDKREGSAYRLVDNRSTEVGGYDEPQLLENLIALSKNGGLEATGYDTEDVDQLFRLLNPNIEEVEVTDEAAILQEKWGTESGQLWNIGNHRLLCGDSANPEEMALLMGGEQASLVVIDPPWNVDYRGGTKEREALANDAIEKGWPLWLTECLSNISAVENAPAYVFFGLMRAGDTQVGITEAGWRICQTLVWVKQHAQFGNFRAHYKYAHEPIYYCSVGERLPEWYGPNNETSVWEEDRAASNKFHPTQKPPALVARAIQNSSRGGDIIVDSFLGGGATMVAAEQINRICYGMEIEPKYVAVTLERMSTMGLEPKLISGA